MQQVLRAAVQQVQVAIQQAAAGGAAGSGAAGTAGAAGANGTAAGPAGAGAGGAGGSQVPQLAEGAEVPMLYVRFRAAAEPNLKGVALGPFGTGIKWFRGLWWDGGSPGRQFKYPL